MSITLSPDLTLTKGLDKKSEILDELMPGRFMNLSKLETGQATIPDLMHDHFFVVLSILIGLSLGNLNSQVSITGANIPDCDGCKFTETKK